MRKTEKHTLSYLLVFFLGFVLLFSPISKIFDNASIVGGIPLSFLFVFSVWLLIIIFLGVLSRKVDSGS